MAAPAGAEAVDAYLDALPAPRREALAHLRAVILAAAPQATQRVSYGIPVFALHGDLVGMGAQARHLALYTMSPPLVAAMKDRLAAFRASGATIRFQVGEPLPDDLVTEIVRQRIAQNLARARP